ncbi:MAG: thiamine diphosphokinase [Candidatus Cloacimonetes bacterium]|nr:thiamine diphosphokinase [Candidatus Cloacimonadota bacterium]
MATHYKKYIYLVSYCTKRDIEYLQHIYQKSDVIVGVDQGAQKLMAAGIMPDYIIGDFDSSPKHSDLPDSCCVIELNPKKDMSDLEYAIDYFLGKSSYSDFDIVILNNLQGRIDHILSTLFLVEKAERISLASCKQLVYLVTSSFSNELPINTTVSLIPISDTVEGVYLEGFEYPLEGETLYRCSSRGLSNISKNKTVTVNIKHGELLLIINIKK